MVKRGGDIPGYGLSGPHSTNLLNFAEKQADKLDARNAWAHCMNELNPGAPDALRVPRTTWFTFPRVGRQWVLVRDDKEDLWVVHGLAFWQALEHQRRLKERVEEAAANTKRDDDDEDGAESDPNDPTSGDGGGGEPRGGEGAGNEGDGAAPESSPDADDDEYQTISAAPRRIRSRRQAQSWPAAILCSVRKVARRAPLFRHTLWLASGTASRLKAAVRRFAAQAQNALSEARLNEFFGDAAEFVQNERFGAALEPQIIERAGLRLTVWTFSPYPRPNWENWLFGRRMEDEQWRYEIGQGA